MRTRNLAPAVVTILLTMTAGAACAGQPEPWQWGFQTPASPVMAKIVDLNFIVSAIIIAILIFVLGLLTVVIFRFNAKRNPVPSKTTHNTVVEVMWTAVPVMLLIVIAIPPTG